MPFLQYPLYTVMAYEKFQNGIPIAWVLTERWETADMALVLKAVKKATEGKRAAMGLDKQRPNCWIVDCATKEQKATTYVNSIVSIELMLSFLCYDMIGLSESDFFGVCKEVYPDVPITLCTQHLMRVWTKNIVAKVLDPFHKADINQHLANIMYNTDLGQTLCPQYGHFNLFLFVLQPER